MKRTLAALTVIVAALLVGAPAVTPARADVGGQVQIADRGDRHDRRDRHDGRRHHRDHKQHWRRGHGHRHGHRGKHWGGSGVILQFGGPPVHRPCHVVQRDGYFYGRYALIGETLCYDRRGRAYIAQGSQFLIHYY